MNKERTIKEYEDMLSLPYDGTQRRPHMSMHDRAAQFAPFAALTGYDAAARKNRLQYSTKQVK